MLWVTKPLGKRVTRKDIWVGGEVRVKADQDLASILEIDLFQLW